LTRKKEGLSYDKQAQWSKRDYVRDLVTLDPGPGRLVKRYGSRYSFREEEGL
jgi:hypothetical protein